jgi:type IV secretory pathway TrbD component
MSETPGWAAPLYQSLTQPHLIAGVSRSVFILDFMFLAITGLWALSRPSLWPLLLVGVLLYGIAWWGTWYDPDFFEIVMAHVRQQDHYEG